MVFESIINFETGHKVKLNPNNSGFSRLGAYVKVKDRVGIVGKIPVKGYTDEKGNPSSVRTGDIFVLWNDQKTYRIVNYKNLKIINL